MGIKLFVIAAALVLASFAALAETSLTSVSRIRMRGLAEEGSRRARQVIRLHNQPNAYLSTILTVNTVAVVVASTAVALLIVDDMHGFPEWLGTVVISVILLMFCEIAPKSLALRFNERLALHVAGPTAALTAVLRPIVGALTWISTMVLRVATKGHAVPGPFVTEDELKMIVSVGEQEGVVEQEERQMIHGILEMTDKAVREIMVPRVDVVGIDAEGTTKELIDLVVAHGHSRIPLYEETIDNIVGVIYAKDLLRHEARSGDGKPLKDLSREPYFTPETKKVGELLHDMQERKVHIAVVVDEYGGTAGIVTIEDLIEEIVGPIRDEYDVAEKEDMQFLSDHEVLINARVPLNDVQELLHVELDDVDADSVGGLIYERLGEIPKPGATITLGDATLTVETVRRQSIQTIRITKREPFLKDREESGSDNGVGDRDVH